jgi:hypothetical protein
MLNADAVAVPPLRVPSDISKNYKLINLAALPDEEVRRHTGLRRGEAFG